MPAHNTTTMGDRLKESLGLAQSRLQDRLQDFESEAHRLFQQWVRRGQASGKDVVHLLQKVNLQEMLDKNQAREWSARARHLRQDLGQRISDVRQKLVGLAGAATREQLEELARDINRLEKRRARQTNGRRPSRQRS
jgi:hypothetical protein